MEKEGTLVQFDMSPINKIIFFKVHIWLFWGVGLLFVGLILQSIIAKHSLINMLEIASFVCGLMYILGLITYAGYRRARFATKVTIDKQKKEFSFYIYDLKKTIILNSDDIAEVANSPSWFRFYFKDGTWVSWVKEESYQKSCEELIKSFGISVITKLTW